jgi:sugar phosphate permease
MCSGSAPATKLLPGNHLHRNNTELQWHTRRSHLPRSHRGWLRAVTYLVSTWFCRFEVQTRIAIFYCAASLVGAFPGLLAHAIFPMDGLANVAGWRGIFIFEGIVTVLTGFVVILALPNSIEQAKWLSAEEKRFL